MAIAATDAELRALGFTPQPDGSWAKTGGARGAPLPVFPAPQRRASGRGIRLAPREPNGLEAAYADELEGAKLVGLIDAWAFEAVVFELGPRTTYRPDFAVWSNGTMSIHELKGPVLEDDASAKFKVFVGLFPHVPAVMVRRDRAGGWRVVFRTAHDGAQFPWLPRPGQRPHR